MRLFAVFFPVADLRFVAFIAAEATPFETLLPFVLSRRSASLESSFLV